ncbi:organic cation/carnitine transporter 2 isoform X1 [Anastrepha ludens]|uniref:organic cation/carnitine transporter 2 isoform X1 n=1 Tax=Anastrepha ludens TaxID=28586 RepID=UPI0023B04467|nr:organic cation/carnitine transporter 2 isoform X1 [Anastrepha ludens]
MSGVLRRGSLNFDCNLNGRNSRGSIDTNLYGGYRDTKPRTPEISVIALDFRRYSEDLKKDSLKTIVNECVPPANGDLSQDVDSDVISNFVGHHGRWQFIWTFLLTLFQIPPTFHLFVYTFQTTTKDFWCARPDNAPDMDVSLWKNLSQPSGPCSILNLNYSQLPELSTTAAPTVLIPCTNFEFSWDDGSARTIIQEFNLVCSRQQLVSVVEMCFLAGAAVGSVSSGWISDRFGRKHTLMAFVLVQLVSGTLQAYAINLAMYMTLRVLTGFASMTVTVVSFVLVVELVSGKWRTITGILNILPVPISYILMACIAYFVRDWRHLQLAISLPWLSLLTIWYCMPESPRWLLAQGCLNELYSLIERAARLNNRTLPPNYQKTLEAAAPPPSSVTTQKLSKEGTIDKEQLGITQLQQQQHQTPTAFMASPEGGLSNICPIDPSATEANPTTHDNPLKVVFNRFYWRTTCLNLVVWLTLIIVYYGLTLHLSNLGGDIYLNTIVAGAIEALSVCISIFVVLKVGLRRSLIAYMLVPGLCCLATNLVPTRDDNQTTVIAMAIIAKCVIGANNAIIPSYTAMQYPTVVRNFGVGLGNLAAGVALILVPYMWLLESIDALLPMSIMGVSGIIGAICLYLMKDVEH